MTLEESIGENISSKRNGRFLSQGVLANSARCIVYFHFLRSIPAQNDLPFPRKITTLTSGSSDSSEKHLPRSSNALHYI